MTELVKPSLDELLLIGTIVAPFGLRGQVKLHSITDRPDHIRQHVRTLYVGPQATPYQLLDIFQHKPGILILSLANVNTRDETEALCGAEVYISEAAAAPLDNDEYFLHQLYNLRVITTEGDELGYVREVLETGSNNVLVVARSGQSDALIPMIHSIVKELDFAGGRIVIQLMSGLLP
jgi:16S rRNA processing protein RimM